MPTSPRRRRRRAGQLPRGQHGLPRAFVHDNQRGRILDSVAAVCAANGYAAMTVEDVIVHAAVSRRTYYDIFADKEEAFLATADAAVDRLLELVAAAYDASDGDWVQKMLAALRALVDFFVAEPDQARLLVVDVLAAGRPALECRDNALGEFAELLQPGPEDVPADGPDARVLAEAMVGGINQALYAQVLDGETERLPELLPDLLYCAVVPFAGHATALAARDGRRRPRLRRVR